MIRECIVCLFFLIPLFLMPLTTFAQDELEAIFELGEVVVSAPKIDAEKTGATTIITAQEIQDAGYRTLDQALTLVPGLHIRTAGRGIPRVDFRGLRTRQLIVLLDGVPIASPWSNQFDPSFYPVENIARIKVTRGPASVIYGDGGNAGVINIVTKKGEKGVHGSINAEGGQNDEYLARGTISHGGEQWNLFTSGSAYTQDDFPLPEGFDSTELEGGDTRINSDRDQYNAFTNLMYSPEKATQFALTLDFKKTEYGVPPDTVSDIFTNKKPKKLSKLKYERMDDKRGFSGQFSFSHEFQSPLSLRGWAYYSALSEEEHEYTDISYDTLKSSDDRDTNRFGANLQPSLDLKSFGSVTMALKAERGDIDSTVKEYTKDKSTEIRQHIYVYSGSLEYRVNPTDPLGIVLGTGWHLQDRNEGDNEDDYSFMTGAYYDLFKLTRLKASVARKIRFPSLRRLYEDKKGNPDLEAERTYHYQIGVEQRIPQLATSLDLILFRIDAEDFIEKDETLDPEQYVNFEEYKFEGVEVSLVNRSIKNLVLKGSYTYLDAENESSNAIFETLEHRPENKVTLQATYHFWENYKAHISYLWLDERGHYSKGKDPQSKEFVLGTLDDYQIFDLKLSRSFLQKSLELYLGGRNLFDEEYEESYSLIMPGRRIYAGVDYSF